MTEPPKTKSSILPIDQWNSDSASHITRSANHHRFTVILEYTMLGLIVLLHDKARQNIFYEFKLNIKNLLQNVTQICIFYEHLMWNGTWIAKILYWLFYHALWCGELHVQKARETKHKPGKNVQSKKQHLGLFVLFIFSNVVRASLVIAGNRQGQKPATDQRSSWPQVISCLITVCLSGVLHQKTGSSQSADQPGQDGAVLTLALQLEPTLRVRRWHNTGPTSVDAGPVLCQRLTFLGSAKVVDRRSYPRWVILYNSGDGGYSTISINK